MVVAYFPWYFTRRPAFGVVVSMLGASWSIMENMQQQMWFCFYPSPISINISSYVYNALRLTPEIWFWAMPFASFQIDINKYFAIVSPRCQVISNCDVMSPWITWQNNRSLFYPENRVLHTLDVVADNSLTGHFRLARPHWNNMARLSCHAKYPNRLQMYGWVICFEINCTWKQMSHRVMFAYRWWSEI